MLNRAQIEALITVLEKGPRDDVPVGLLLFYAAMEIEEEELFSRVFEVANNHFLECQSMVRQVSL